MHKRFEVIKYKLYDRVEKTSYWVPGENISTELIILYRENSPEIKKYKIISVIFQDEEGDVFELKREIELFQD